MSEFDMDAETSAATRRTPQQNEVAAGVANGGFMTGAKNISALFGTARTRGVLVATAALVVMAIVVTIVWKPHPPAPLPDNMRGADVGAPPAGVGLADDPLSKTPQYKDMVAAANRRHIDAQAANGQSAMPLADSVDLQKMQPGQQFAVNPTAPVAKPVAAPAPSAAPTSLPPGASVLPLSGEVVVTPPPLGSGGTITAAGPNRIVLDADTRAAVQELLAQVTDFNGYRRAEYAQSQQVVEPGGNAPATAPTQPTSGPVAQPAPAAKDAKEATAEVTGPSVTLITAGTLLAAKTDIAINTDVAGPVGATLVTGPYAGSKLIGTSQRQGQLAKINFTAMSVKGLSSVVPINAVGLDSVTTEAATATDVNNHVMLKYVGQPFAAAVAALGQAFRNAGTTVNISTAGTTQTTVPLPNGQQMGYIAAGGAADTLNKDISNLPTDPTVRVARDTVIGVYFTTDVKAPLK